MEFNQGLIADLKQRGGRLEEATLLGDTEVGWQGLCEKAWDERLQQLASAAKVDLAQLGPRKSDPVRCSWRPRYERSRA